MKTDLRSSFIGNIPCFVELLFKKSALDFITGKELKKKLYLIMAALSAQSVGKDDNKAHHDLRAEYFKQMISLKKLCYCENTITLMSIISLNIDITAQPESILFLVMDHLRKATIKQPRWMFFSKKINIGDQILKERGQIKGLEARAMLNFYWLNTVASHQREWLFFGYIREFEKNYQQCDVPNEVQKKIYSFTFLNSAVAENQLDTDDFFEVRQSVLMPANTS